MHHQMKMRKFPLPEKQQIWEENLWDAELHTGSYRESHQSMDISQPVLDGYIKCKDMKKYAKIKWTLGTSVMHLIQVEGYARDT